MIDSQLGNANVPVWQVYAPVLRAKTSEWKALTLLTPGVRRRISPIMEFVPEWREHAHAAGNGTKRKPRSPQTAADYVRQMLERAVNSTPSGTSSFVYFGNSGRTSEFRGTDLWSAFGAHVPNGAGVLPLVDLPAVPAIQARVARAARHAGTVGFRVCIGELNGTLEKQIRDAMRALDVSANSTHVVFDFKDSPEAASHSSVRGLLSDIDRFASVTVLAGVFPVDLTEYEPGVRPENRREWEVWRSEHVATPKRERFLGYGDYTTQCAHYRPSPAVPGSVSLRYTTDKAILVFRGRQSNSSAGLGYEQIHGHCRLLVNRPDYDGAVFSYGDQRVHCWTDPTQGPGNPEQWRVASLAHHMTHVVFQLQDPMGSTTSVRAWARAQAPVACK